MSSFLKKIEFSFSDGLVLPDEFKAMFAWMEANGFVHGDRDRRYAALYPFVEDADGRTLSLVRFQPVDPGHVRAWTDSDDPAVNGRLAPFIRTGGDGSYAGLWRDDDGCPRFVHLGSGSGSTMLCTLADSPVDFLRLLAIGYEELCWPEMFDVTPDEAFADSHAEDEELLPPIQFRSWVESTFGVMVPETASEIVRSTADMDAARSDDPFWLWIRRLQGMA